MYGYMQNQKKKGNTGSETNEDMSTMIPIFYKWFLQFALILV